MVAYVVPVGTVKRRISLRPCRLAVILMSIPDITRRRQPTRRLRALNVKDRPWLGCYYPFFRLLEIPDAVRI